MHTSGAPNPDAFTAHRDALLNFSICVPALTAAFVLTNESRYAQQAIDSSTGLVHRPRDPHDARAFSTARPFHPQRRAAPKASSKPCIWQRSFNACRSSTTQRRLTESDHAALQKWFAEYFELAQHLAPRRPRTRQQESPTAAHGCFKPPPSLTSPRSADDAPLTTLASSVQIQHHSRADRCRWHVSSRADYAQSLSQYALQS